MAMLGATFIKLKLQQQAAEAREARARSEEAEVDKHATHSFAVSHFLKRVPKRQSLWEPGELTPCIYNDKIHTSYKSSLLSFDRIISVEPAQGQKGEEKVIPAGLYRFTTDKRAKAVDIFEMLVTVASLFVFPLTFLHGGSWAEPEVIPGGRGLLVLDLFLDLLYLLTIILDFNVSYLHKRKGHEVVSRKSIIRHIVSNPYVWMSLVSCTCPLWIIAGAPPLINNLKLVRIRHVAEMPDSLWFYRDKAWARLSRPIFFLCGASHWMACTLSYFAGYREALVAGRAHEFETHFGQDTVNGKFSLYLFALVESVYLLTGAIDNPTGDGSVRDKQFGSLVLVCIFGPVGCIVASVLTASLSTEFSMAYALQAKHEENKAFMTHALRILNIPKPLRKRVFSQFYFQKMGHDVEAFEALFNKKNLSLALENALLVYLYKDTVITSELFSGRDANYVIEVLRVLNSQVFLPGDYVARRGEIAFTMYFVSKGQLALLVPNQSPDKQSDVRQAKDVKKFEVGANFGEIALIKNCMRTAWVRAEDYSVLSALDRDKIEPVWFHFPEERQKILDQVQQHKESDRKRALQAKQKRAFGKAKLIAKMGGMGSFKHPEDEGKSGDSLGDHIGHHATEFVLDDSEEDEGGGAMAHGSPLAVGLRRSNMNGKAPKGGRLQPVDVTAMNMTLNKILERQAAVEKTLKKVLQVMDPQGKNSMDGMLSTVSASPRPSACLPVSLMVPGPKVPTATAAPQPTSPSGFGGLGALAMRLVVEPPTAAPAAVEPAAAAPAAAEPESAEPPLSPADIEVVDTQAQGSSGASAGSTLNNTSTSTAASSGSRVPTTPASAIYKWPAKGPKKTGQVQMAGVSSDRSSKSKPGRPKGHHSGGGEGDLFAK